MAKGKKKMSANHKGNLNPSRPSGKAPKQHPKTFSPEKRSLVCANHSQ